MVAPYRTFLLVGFLDMMSVYFILPYLDIHAKELRFNHIQIGIIAAIYPACQLISSPFVGSLSDVRGRKPVLMLCLIICSCAYFCLGVTSSLLVFISIRAVLGIFKHTQTLTRAIAPDYLEDQNDIVALYGKLTSLRGPAMALGPLASGYVMEALPDSGFAVMSAFLAAFFILNASLIRSLPDIPTEKKDKSETVFKATKLFNPIIDTYNRTIDNFYKLNWTIYWDIFLFQFLMSTSIGLYFNNFRLFLLNEHDVSPSILGYITTFQGIVGTITNETVSYFNKKYYVNDRDFTQRIFHIFLVMMLSFIGFTVVPIPLYVAILLPTAVCFAFSKIIILVLLTNRSMTGNRGTLVATFNSLNSISDIISPIVGGIISHYLGATYVFYIAAMIASIGLVLSSRARIRSLHQKSL